MPEGAASRRGDCGSKGATPWMFYLLSLNNDIQISSLDAGTPDSVLLALHPFDKGHQTVSELSLVAFDHGRVHLL